MSLVTNFLLLLLCTLNGLILLCSAGPLVVMGSRGRRMDNPDEGTGFFEGDIIMPIQDDADAAPAKAGLIDTNYRWKDARVFYDIDVSSFTQNELVIIKTAMEEITNKTCIQFQQRTSQPDWINIIGHKEGCWSYVGRRGGMQELNLSPPKDSSQRTCVTHGVVGHELIHALGFYHEHSRTDRDDWVTIHFENIDKSEHQNFKNYSSTTVTHFDLPYDYGSLMHYSPYAFSMNQKQTITPKREGVIIGQRRGLSELDAEKVRRMYKTHRVCSNGSEGGAQFFVFAKKLSALLVQFNEKLDEIMRQL